LATYHGAVFSTEVIVRSGDGQLMLKHRVAELKFIYLVRVMVVVKKTPSAIEDA